MVLFSHRGFYKSQESSGEELVELQQLPSQQHALRTHNELVTAPVTLLRLTHSPASSYPPRSIHRAFQLKNLAGTRRGRLGSLCTRARMAARDRLALGTVIAVLLEEHCGARLIELLY